MSKKIRKILLCPLFCDLFSFLFVFFLFNNHALAQGNTEVEYPTIPGAPLPNQIEQISIPDYIKYIFNFSIITVGLIAFGVLVFAGFRYLSSAGSSEAISAAKKQIKSSIFGIFLLLASYLILTTINPQLIVIQIGQPPEATSSPVASTPIIPLPRDLLSRIQDMAEKIKEMVVSLSETAGEINSLTGSCDCNTTQPMCLCQDYMGGSCSADHCYSASPDQPCPYWSEITENQKTIIELVEELLYYKNRSLGEKGDLADDVAKIVVPKIDWYTKALTAENKVLNSGKLNDAAKEQEENLIKTLESGKEEVDAQKKYKECLEVKLNDLANKLAALKGAATQLSQLPDQCLSNIESKCKGSCSGGCHNTTGCFAGSCSGGNPCPTEIGTQANSIKIDDIIALCDEIIQIIYKVRETPVPDLPDCGVIPSQPPPPPPPQGTCGSPETLAKANNEPYPARTSSSVQKELLPCIAQKTGQPLPSEGGSNSFYGSMFTFDHTHESCNYTRGQPTCETCSHTVNSCHYGGANGSDGALAVDFGNEKNADKIMAAAKQCGAKYVATEGDHIHISIDCSGN